MKINIDNRLFSKMGFHFAWGAVQLFGVMLWVTLLLIALADWAGWFPRDATDSQTKRSNLTLRTDYGTGCQYLQTSEGGITPRLDRTGKQVCQ